MRPILGTCLALLCLASWPEPDSETTNPLAQEPGMPAATAPDEKNQLLSGRILDGLGRPVSEVKVEVMSPTPGHEKPLAVIFTDEDGRFSRSIAKEFKKVDLGFEKTDYVYTRVTSPVSVATDFTMLHQIDWKDLDLLPWSKGDKLDQGMRELLAAGEGPDAKFEFEGFHSRESTEWVLLRYLFKYQEQLRPAMRRLINDPHVGWGARLWLDRFGNSADQDLFPKGRRFAPKHEIGEEDLVESIKAISSRLNFFSDNPEPKIDIDTITFTPKLDRALVECGINLGPLTGVFWQFVFHKEGKRWILRSMEEVGRG